MMLSDKRNPNSRSSCNNNNNADSSRTSSDTRSSSREETAGTVSSLSVESLEGNTAARALDGNAFLQHLRASGHFGHDDASCQDSIGHSAKRSQEPSSHAERLEVATRLSSHHEDTVRVSNRQTTYGGQVTPLSDLFMPPPPPPPPTSTGPAFPGTANTSFATQTATSSSPPPTWPGVLKTRNQTSPPVESSPAPSHHSRSVSWGNNTTFVAPHPPVHNRTPSSENSLENVSSLGDDNHRRTNTQITLEDIERSAPYEAEAESNIIRAMEAHHAIQGRTRSNTAETSSSLLDKVPEDRVHDFTLDNLDVTGTPEVGLPRPQSSSDQERVPLVIINNTNRTSQHRRHLSVEQTLAGLTQAMSALHGDHGRGGRNKDPSPLSSADAFAMNASRLSEQRTLEDTSIHTRRAWRRDNLSMVLEHPHQPQLPSSSRVGANNDNSIGNSEIDVDAVNGASGRAIHDDGDDDDIETQRQPRPTSSLSTVDESSFGDDPNADTRRNDGRSKLQRRSSIFDGASDQLKSDWEDYCVFACRPHRGYIATYVKNIVLYIIVPLTGIALILFYLADNPPTGTNQDEQPSEGQPASVSWWLLFAVREVITFSLALALQGLIVDFLCLNTKIMLRLSGPIVTLLIVQSKGWPFICFWWAILDFLMLTGDSPFARHWLYWQNWLGIFNETNPSGTFPSNDLHRTVLTVVASVSAVAAVKRFVMGMFLGISTFRHYGEELAKIMNCMLLVSELAVLAKDIERSKIDVNLSVPFTPEQQMLERGRIDSENDDITVNTIIDSASRNPLTGDLPASAKAKLMRLLGQWEEPSLTYDQRHLEIASISAVLRFRKALTFIRRRYPFSYPFGPADTRTACIESAQNVYNRLLMRKQDSVLQFETIALLALEGDGSIDQEKAKDLVRLFRPDREGNLTLLDFVKSVDSVYKNFRMLEASIENSSQIDRAFENMFNVVFYGIVLTIVLSFLGFNPLALFLSISSLILGFAFMIGSASSKYFEGVLFILVRRPYGIGDRIHISNIENDTSLEGTPGWIVEKITLFETVATWTPTQESCSLSNGSLASSKIINAARSKHAQFHVFLKFPIDTPYERILIFKAAIEEFMRVRPREWIALNGFRAHRVVADQGYVEYIIIIRHRENWQNIGQVLDSKANLSSYCNEVARQLKMHYRAPPLPVDLLGYGKDALQQQFLNQRVEQTDHGESITSTEMDEGERILQFRQIAQTKHNIRLN